MTVKKGGYVDDYSQTPVQDEYMLYKGAVSTSTSSGAVTISTPGLNNGNSTDTVKLGGNGRVTAELPDNFLYILELLVEVVVETVVEVVVETVVETVVDVEIKEVIMQILK